MPFDGVGTAEAGRRERWIGLLCALLLLAIWAAYILMTRFSLRTHFAPADLLALRVGIGGILVLPWFARRGLGHLNLRQALVLALSAGLGFGVFSYGGFVLAPVAHASALQTGALPLYTALLAVVVLHERYSPGKQLGLALIVLGVALMGYESVSSGAAGQWRGDVLFSTASFSWAIYAVAAQCWNVRPLQATSVVYVISAALYLPVYVLFFDSRLLEAPWAELAVQALLQGVFANLVSLFLFARVSQAFGATSTAMLTATASLFVPALGIVTLGERPSLLAWTGLVCVAAGVIMAVMVVRPCAPQTLPSG